MKKHQIILDSYNAFIGFKKKKKKLRIPIHLK
jgi:hypothetical protein